ncbi:MAG: class I SAM-dependent methyltransferase [Bacteroidota bacterium]
MAIYTTEITSDQIASDNPIHQRLLKAYIEAVPYIQGDLLELGVGEGRGIEWMAPKASSYLGLDKIEDAILKLSQKFPELQFESSVFPPVKLPDESFDTIVSFQVIEHIKNDHLFLEEIYRMLKKGGKAIISTPNRLMSLSRNPWHIREYTANELEELCKKYFDKVSMMGIAGNEKVMTYHERNRKSVDKIMRFDVLDLQHRLPASILRIPYDLLNRFNRNSLKSQADELVMSISDDDYLLKEKNDQNLDLFCVLERKK